MNNGVKLILSRRNLLTLLSKLDRVKAGGESARTLIKYDTAHTLYPLTGADYVVVTAVEDEDYYINRKPGPTKEFPDVQC